MSNRSLNGFTSNLRSLNGLEGVAIETILGGDGISILDNSKAKKTINVDISKQDATTVVADDDLFLLENSSGTIKKITGLHLKDASDGFFFKNNNDIFADVATDNLVLGSISTSVNSGGYKLYILGTAFFSGAITNDALSTFNASLAVKNVSNPTESGFIQFFDEDNSHSVKLFAGGTTQSVSVDRVQFLPDATGTVALLESLSASAPLVYNNSTGAFSFDNSSTGYITLSSLSASSPLSYDNSSGAFSTTFTASSVDTLTNKTFDSAVVPFNKGLSTKFDSNTTTSGFIRFFEKTSSGSNYADLHLQDHRVIDPVGTGSGNINVFLPTTVNDTILVGRDTTDTLTNKTITSFTGGSGATITSPSTSTVLVGRDTTDTLTNKTIASFEGNSGATITTPNTTGTLALANATHTSKWNDSSNVYTPTNSSLTAIDLPEGCLIRNAGDTTNDFIRFEQDSFYVNFINFDLKQDSKIRNFNRQSTDYISFQDGILYSNYANIDVIEGVKIRNASDTTNDFISLRSNHLYINYAITEVIQGGKIANGSDPNNDFIQFNDNELYINYAVVDVKQGTVFQNASNNSSAFSFESDRIKFINPVQMISGDGITSYYPLEVEGYKTAPDTTGSALYYQNVPSLGGRAIAINGDVPMSAKFEYGLYVETGTELWVASDERIKKDITTFTGGLDLLRKLEIKNFKYIDGRGKEPKHNEIGFIAQEVKEIYPNAISLNKEYIPNVYKKITCEWTASDEKFKMKTTDLPDVVGVDYKFFAWNEGDKIETKITAIGNSDNTFTFDKKWENVFCIGNKVNDFNTLDKSSLYVINFSATKELDNIVKQQQQTIQDLQEQINSLKTTIDKLNSSKSFKEFKSN